MTSHYSGTNENLTADDADNADREEGLSREFTRNARIRNETEALANCQLLFANCYLQISVICVISGKVLEMFFQVPEFLHLQQRQPLWRRINCFMLQDPCHVMGDEHRVNARGQGGIDVRLGAVADHPCGGFA